MRSSGQEVTATSRTRAGAPDCAWPSPARFAKTAFAPNDWVAVFLKSYVDGRVAQRVAGIAWVLSDPVQAWLRAMNAHRYNIYVSVNAVREGARSRTRDAIASVRHVFLEADRDGDLILDAIGKRPDLPPISYVLHSSPDRVHVFWRAEGFATDQVERLQKHLARQLGTDQASTPATQNTRLPGFFNHKHAEPYRVHVEYRDPITTFSPADFPQVSSVEPKQRRANRPLIATPPDAASRARAYLERTPPAVAGQHGDARTFQVCCRLVRGFALDDDEAFELLQSWNAGCEPPWSDAELRDKLRHARQYGRESVGGLL